MEETASYGNDVYGAYCGHTRSAVVRIQVTVVIGICAQRDRNI